jgi:radical SAM superfamily enzyme YgiQ (UPF0313 family)
MILIKWLALPGRKQLNNILLLSCRSPFLENDKIYPPLANLYLQGAIKRDNPDVKVTVKDDYDLNDIDWMKEFDGIGVSVMTPQRAEADKLLKAIRSKFKMPVFVGGPHAKHYDMRGQGWSTVVTDDGFRAIDHIVNNNAPEVITDKIPMRDYFKYVSKPARLENEGLLRGYRYTLEGIVGTTMLTAQGCSEQCTFCEDALSQVRFTPFEQIKQELDDIKNLGYGAVYVFDDIFALSKKNSQPVAEEMKKRGLIYRCNGQARLMNDEFMGMLEATGCREIAFGAETGSQKILDNVRKRTTVAQNYQFVRLARKYDIPVKAFIMLGLPGETEETIQETENFIKNSGIKDFQLAIYYPYKGTQIRDALDRGDKSQDIHFLGEGLGAYGQKGGYGDSVVETRELSSLQLAYHQDRLTKLYKGKL